MLRVVVKARNPKTHHKAEIVIEETLGTAMHACRCTTSSVLGYNTPGSLAFGRDMYMDIPFVADILAVRNNRQLLVNQ